jgi:hypothetical protein
VGAFDDGRMGRAPPPQPLQGGAEGSPGAAPQPGDASDQPAALLALLDLGVQHAGLHLPPPAVPSPAAHPLADMGGQRADVMAQPITGDHR